MAEPEKQRNPVEELAESFLRRYREGELPSITEFVARHPELAAEIRELFPALLVMEQAGARESDPARAEHTADGRQPQQIGGYRIIREIRRGGMGVVYEAEQVSLGQVHGVPSAVREDATSLFRRGQSSPGKVLPIAPRLRRAKHRQASTRRIAPCRRVQAQPNVPISSTEPLASVCAKIPAA